MEFRRVKTDVDDLIQNSFSVNDPDHPLAKDIGKDIKWLISGMARPATGMIVGIQKNYRGNIIYTVKRLDIDLSWTEALDPEDIIEWL